jgi:hypothetical protein
VCDLFMPFFIVCVLFSLLLLLFVSLALDAIPLSIISSLMILALKFLSPKSKFGNKVNCLFVAVTSMAEMDFFDADFKLLVERELLD